MTKEKQKKKKTNGPSSAGAATSFCQLHQGNPYTRFTQTYWVSVNPSLELIRLHLPGPDTVMMHRMPSCGRPKVSEWSKLRVFESERIRQHPRTHSHQWNLCPGRISGLSSLAGSIAMAVKRSVWVCTPSLSPGATLPHTQATRHSQTSLTTSPNQPQKRRKKSHTPVIHPEQF